jgi:DNA-binding transcriptional MerR regulator
MGKKSYRSKAVLKLVEGLGPGGSGITLNQQLHWVERKIIGPSVKDADGHASYREYSLEDILRMVMVSRFLSIGMTLKEVGVLMNKGLSSVTTISDENPCSLWDVLANKAIREKYRYFFQVEYLDNNSIKTRSGFCGGLHEIFGLMTRRGCPVYLTQVKMVDIVGILEMLEAKTGDTL